ncbi:MAG: hypothetical protein U5K72_01640 [Balneolaceae bacterium]|nr:hypothetical protein [Balneolaceae bacterium]
MAKEDKKIIIEFVDEDFFKNLEEENRKKFLSELESLQLKYTVGNIEKYATFLNEKLEFPFVGYHNIDNGMFGEKRVQIKVEGIIENRSKQPIKCSCKTSRNATKKIYLHFIEVDETDKNKEMIDHYKKWYFKNH